MGAQAASGPAVPARAGVRGVSRTPVAARGWRGRMGRELGWIFLIKLAALTLLWWLFFAAHRPLVDGQAVSRQLAVAPVHAVPSNPTLTSEELRHD